MNCQTLIYPGGSRRNFPRKLARWKFGRKPVEMLVWISGGIIGRISKGNLGRIPGEGYTTFPLIPVPRIINYEPSFLIENSLEFNEWQYVLSWELLNISSFNCLSFSLDHYSGTVDSLLFELSQFSLELVIQGAGVQGNDIKGNEGKK